MAEGTRDVVLLAGRLSVADADVIRGLVARLAKRGFSASVICASAGEGQASEFGFQECPGLLARWRRPWAVRGLTSEAGRPRPALLHALGAGLADAALALAERWRIPYLLTVDDFLPPGGRLRLSRAWCRKILATGRQLADDLIESVGVPRRGVAVVRPGVAVEEPAGLASDEPTRVPVVGAAGPLASGSGLASFLQAARLGIAAGLDAEFLIAGRGPAEEPLRRLAGRLRIADRVTFASGEADLEAFWRVLDVFCMTSIEPTTGRALSRALARGVPCIATDVNGLDCLVVDGVTALRVPAGDSEALAEAVRSVVSDSALARRLGRRGRDLIARDFDPEREADHLAIAYRRALESEDGVVARPGPTRADRRHATAG